MDIMDRIYEKAASNPQRVTFSECTEEKILKACRECVDKGLIIPVLVGNSEEIKAAAANGYSPVTNFEQLISEIQNGTFLDNVAKFSTQAELK